jgi:hypothetical protein
MATHHRICPFNAARRSIRVDKTHVRSSIRVDSLATCDCHIDLIESVWHHLNDYRHGTDCTCTVFIDDYRGVRARYSHYTEKNRVNSVPKDMIQAARSWVILLVLIWSGGARCVAGVDSWTLRSSSAINPAGISYGNGRYVIAGTSSANSASSDGINWTTQSIGSQNGLSRVAFGNGTFVTFGRLPSSDFGPFTSTDGLTWIPHGAVTFVYPSLFARGKFFGAGAGVVASSNDGITWSQITAPENVFYSSVADGNGRLVAVGGSVSNSVLATSDDGVSWISHPSPAAKRLVAVAFGNGVLWRWSRSQSRPGYPPMASRGTGHRCPRRRRTATPRLRSAISFSREDNSSQPRAPTSLPPRTASIGRWCRAPWARRGTLLSF